MAAVSVIVGIPLTSNEKQTYSEAHHHAFDRFIVDLGFDFSIWNRPIQGTWQGMTESSLIYEIAVESLLRAAPKIITVSEFAKLHYQQVAIFVRYLGVAETF